MGIFHRGLLVLLCVLLGTQGHAMARHLEGHKQHPTHHHSLHKAHHPAEHQGLVANAADTEHQGQSAWSKPLGKCMTGAQVYNVETTVVTWSTPPAFATPRVDMPYTLTLSHPVPERPPRQLF